MAHKFILTYENLLTTCQKVLAKYPDVKLKIEHSPNQNSNSFYLRFYLGKTNSSLRVSDHETTLTEQGGGIRNIVIGKHTKSSAVEAKIIESINALKYKIHQVHMTDLYKKIGQQSNGQN